jgi:hypothetical protein
MITFQPQPQLPLKRGRRFGFSTGATAPPSALAYFRSASRRLSLAWTVAASIAYSSTNRCCFG